MRVWYLGPRGDWGVPCRFPNGESGADVYDRMTIFEDHLVRDINAGEHGLLFSGPNIMM